MTKVQKRSLCIFSGLLVPFLTFLSPSWLTISGVGPCWAILWLLPWSLVGNQFYAVVGGCCLGLILDAISLSGLTQVPALIALGFWWGRLGRRGQPIRSVFSFGVFAWIGSILIGLSLWLQAFFTQIPRSYLSEWGLNTLVSQAFLTALLAPISCSWLLLAWRNRSSN